MTVGQRVREIRKERGFTQDGLAKLVGVKQETVSQLENGKSKETRLIASFAKALKVNSYWLETGKGDKYPDVSNIESLPDEPSRVPVISWVAAGNWATMQDQRAEPLEWLMCPIKHSADTYALIVKGLSMYNPLGERSFKDGDIIFIDPLIDPKHKDFVVAKIESEQEATFKQLIIEDGRKNLMAINPGWEPKFMPINGSAAILGVVIGKVERWR